MARSVSGFVPEVLRARNFGLFWTGLTLFQLGARAVLTANLWQMYELTGSTLQVGLIGLFEALSTVVIGPLGGAIADRIDRRRLMQVTQAVSLATASTLSVLTFTHTIQPWHIYVAVLLVSAAATFDGAARQALIPLLVPKERLVDAFSLMVPARELSVLFGPSLAGVLIATVGTGSVYVFGTVGSVTLVILLMLVKTPPLPARPSAPLLQSIAEGFRFVQRRPLIWQLMSLDFSVTFFAAYRVLLPALARDVLRVGPEGYGLLASAPAVGAILGSVVAFRLRGVPSKGLLVLGITGAYALTAMGLARAPAFVLALAAAAGLGFFDAIATTLRHALVQMETPDELRGRVTSVYQMVSRGGPSLGQAYMGMLAASFGPATALTLSAILPLAYALSLASAGKTVRGYTTLPAAAEA